MGIVRWSTIILRRRARSESPISWETRRSAKQIANERERGDVFVTRAGTGRSIIERLILSGIRWCRPGGGEVQMAGLLGRRWLPERVEVRARRGCA